MNRLYLISIFVILLLSMGCKKEPDNPWALDPSANDGTLTAVLNGEAWHNDIVTGTLSNSDPSTFAISAGVFLGGIERQSLSLVNIKKDIGSYVLLPQLRMLNDSTGIPREFLVSSAGYSLFAYDVGENGYTVLDDSNSYIKIESYNTDEALPRVKGSFQVILYRLRKGSRPPTQNMPDTLRFTNGKFDVQIRDRSGN